MVPVSAGAFLVPGVSGGGFADNIVRQADGVGIGGARAVRKLDNLADDPIWYENVQRWQDAQGRFSKRHRSFYIWRWTK
jgi:hypothetical protein